MHIDVDVKSQIYLELKALIESPNQSQLKFNQEQRRGNYQLIINKE